MEIDESNNYHGPFSIHASRESKLFESENCDALFHSMNFKLYKEINLKEITSIRNNAKPIQITFIKKGFSITTSNRRISGHLTDSARLISFVKMYSLFVNTLFDENDKMPIFMYHTSEDSPLISNLFSQLKDNIKHVYSRREYPLLTLFTDINYKTSKKVNIYFKESSYTDVESSPSTDPNDESSYSNSGELSNESTSKITVRAKIRRYSANFKQRRRSRVTRENETKPPDIVPHLQTNISFFSEDSPRDSNMQLRTFSDASEEGCLSVSPHSPQGIEGQKTLPVLYACFGKLCKQYDYEINLRDGLITITLPDDYKILCNKHEMATNLTEFKAFDLFITALKKLPCIESITEEETDALGLFRYNV